MAELVTGAGAPRGVLGMARGLCKRTLLVPLMFLLAGGASGCSKRPMDEGQTPSNQAPGLGSEHHEPEGGTGTRAKGEDAAMGQGSEDTNKRYAVQGPEDNSSGQGSAAVGQSMGAGGLGLSGTGMGGGGIGMGFGSGHGRLSLGVATPQLNTESYARVDESGFVRTETDTRSTFSIDVDTASYSLVRRHLSDGHLPPTGAVRVEEMLNYFSYSYPEPDANRPFSIHSELSHAPWNQAHKLLKLGLKARHIDTSERPDANLVFLVDVSGSMQSPDKLPLLKHGLRMLSEQLRAGDRVSIVVYAGASGLVLPSTAGNRSSVITEALERLEAGGSTNGADGIQLAYAVAQNGFKRGGINRVILATDGDFNVGVTNQSQLVELIQKKAKGGVFLSVLGFGRGNYKDDTLEQLADKGNGSYAYIDSGSEARKVLVEQASGTLITVAQDVKLQIEFNPAHVAGFRLIGYENRRLAHQDFADDTKDAGEIGADHTVTALYEIVPHGVAVPAAKAEPSKYVQPPALSEAAKSDELLTVHLRYKQPTHESSTKFSVAVQSDAVALPQASSDFLFAAAVAELGLLLSDSAYRGTASYDRAIANAEGAVLGNDRRREFVHLAQRAKSLTN